MEVIIDSQVYVPKTDVESKPSFGVAITTHNRNELVLANKQRWIENSPAGTPIFIVDDASQIPVTGADYRFNKNAGIAGAKNKSIELLLNYGVEHLFLVDDDCYPLTKDWYKPYIESPEPHLMSIFTHFKGKGNGPVGDCDLIYADENIVSYTGVRGHFIYVEKKCIEAVGGFDLIYGRWGYEHVDFSNRVHNAGLTSFYYADVPNSENLIYSADQHCEIARTVPTVERQQLVHKNGLICHERRLTGYKEYVPFRETRNVVITSLFGGGDPQRNNVEMTLPQLSKLLNSIQGSDIVVNSNLEGTLPKAEMVFQERIMNVFFQRHYSALKYLEIHPEIQYVFCVDGTDVEMLQQPWHEMKPGKLYIGWEPQIIGIPWMKNNHPTKAFQDFLETHSDQTLLNAGVFGGDRNTVIEFLKGVMRYYFNMKIENQLVNSKAEDLGEMAAFNLVAYTAFNGRIVTGSKVTTVFKAEERNTISWWKHK